MGCPHESQEIAIVEVVPANLKRCKICTSSQFNFAEGALWCVDCWTRLTVVSEKVKVA